MKLRVRRHELSHEDRGFLVVVEDADGVRGFGEASPIAGYAPDDSRIVAARLAYAATPLEGARIEPEIAAVEAWLEARELDLDVAPSARFALETALLDWTARVREIPLHALLAGESAHARLLDRNGLISSWANAEELVTKAHVLAARGLRTLKVKIAPTSVRDRFDDLVQLRAAWRGALRFDANGAFGLEEARVMLEDLALLEPELVEEPTRGRALLELGETACAWAADESLVDADLAEELIARGACAAIVLKPALVGGLVRARRLAGRAESRGIGVVITHARGGPVGLAAACELALSLDEAPLACGLDPHPGLDDWPACHLSQLDESAHVTAGLEAGLGVHPLAEGAEW